MKNDSNQLVRYLPIDGFCLDIEQNSCGSNLSLAKEGHVLVSCASVLVMCLGYRYSRDFRSHVAAGHVAAMSRKTRIRPHSRIGADGRCTGI